MDVLFIAAIAVLVVLMVFLFIVVRRVGAALNHRIKDDFADQLEAYEDIASKRIDYYETLQIETERLEREKIEASRRPPHPAAIDVHITYMPLPAFRSGAFGFDYKRIKQAYAFDRTEMLAPREQEIFGAPTRAEQQRISGLNSLLKMLDRDTVYEMLTLEPDVQLGLLREACVGSKAAVLEEYLQEFRWNDVLELLRWAETKAKSADPSVVIRVNELEDTGWINTMAQHNVEVVQDPYLCEGFHIFSRGKMYDYGLTMKEIV